VASACVTFPDCPEPADEPSGFCLQGTGDRRACAGGEQLGLIVFLEDWRSVDPLVAELGAYLATHNRGDQLHLAVTVFCAQ
jgi:hypothetical protein